MMIGSGASFSVAILQVNAGIDMAENIASAVELATAARAEGADMVFMPENVTMMAWGRKHILSKAHPEETHPAIPAFQKLARDTGLWVHGGTLSVLLSETQIANRTYVFDPSGAVVGQYDKIHMFDVDLGGGEVYRESATFRPGGEAVTVDLPWLRLGLSVCYDLRFPHLFRQLAQSGAGCLTVPAAFTRTTGEAHWHILLRARAIETGCWVIAPAQTGTHDADRKTYGHALVIDPWGEVVCDLGVEPGYGIATIDPAAIGTARGKVPSLSHDRPFQIRQSAS